LFATAWPFEGDCGPSASPCWLERDTLFWDRIEHTWLDAGSSSSSSGGGGGGGSGGGGYVNRLASGGGGMGSGSGGSGCGPCSLQQLPLYSNFSVGAGRAFYQGGRPVGGAWYDLSLQARQPLLRMQLTDCADSSSSGSPTSSSPTIASPGGSAGTSWVALLQGLCSRMLRSLQGWLGWQEEPCPVRAAVVDAVAFSGGSALRVSGCLPPGQQAGVQLFPAAVPLPAGGICVRLAAICTGRADVRLVIRLAAAANGAAAGAAGQAAGHGAPCCGTLELVPGLGAPEDASAAAAAEGVALQGWSRGPVATATADSCSSAAWHPVQQPSSSSAAARAGQVPADQPAEWRIWEYHLPQRSLVAAFGAATSSSGSRAAEGEGAAPPVLLEGVHLLVRSSEQEGEHGSPGFELHLGEVNWGARVSWVH